MHEPMTSIADAASSQQTCPVELLWIPLGAGQHVVRLSGRAFEALIAFVQHRPACDLYHSALVITVPGGRYVIEMTPVPDRHGDQRGVVAEGAVGSAWLGMLRVFRYEIHRWHDGVIPDADQATAGGVDTTLLAPPNGGRAPGWDAGLVVAGRTANAE